MIVGGGASRGQGLGVMTLVSGLSSLYPVEVLWCDLEIVFMSSCDCVDTHNVVGMCSS